MITRSTSAVQVISFLEMQESDSILSMPTLSPMLPPLLLPPIPPTMQVDPVRYPTLPPKFTFGLTIQTTRFANITLTMGIFAHQSNLTTARCAKLHMGMAQLCFRMPPTPSSPTTATPMLARQLRMRAGSSRAPNVRYRNQSAAIVNQSSSLSFAFFGCRSDLFR